MPGSSTTWLRTLSIRRDAVKRSGASWGMGLLSPGKICLPKHFILGFLLGFCFILSSSSTLLTVLQRMWKQRRQATILLFSRGLKIIPLHFANQVHTFISYLFHCFCIQYCVKCLLSFFHRVSGALEMGT